MPGYQSGEGVFKPTPAVGYQPGVLQVSLRLRPKWSIVMLLKLFHQQYIPGALIPDLTVGLCDVHSQATSKESANKESIYSLS